MGPEAKKRRREKQLAKAEIYRLQTELVRAQGGSCGNCQHCGVMPLSAQVPICELDSDFHGYAVVTLDLACGRWERKA